MFWSLYAMLVRKLGFSKRQYNIFQLVYLQTKPESHINQRNSPKSRTSEPDSLLPRRQLVALNSSRNPPLVLTGDGNSLHLSSSSVTDIQFLQQLDIHSQLGNVLLNETFHHRVSSNGIALTTEWTVVDNGNTSSPSRWQLNLSTGILSQLSLINDGNNTQSNIPHLGTYFLYNDGKNWTNYLFSIQVRANGSNGAFGLMFRVASNAEYYRFLWNNANSTGVYQRLEQHGQNTFRVLNQTTGIGYPFGTWMILTAVCNGPILQIFANQTNVLQANVSTSPISQGSVALYTYDDDVVQFREAVVVAVQSTPTPSTVTQIPSLQATATPITTKSTSTPTATPHVVTTIQPSKTPTATPTPSPTPTATLATTQPQPILQHGQALLQFVIKFGDLSLSNYSSNLNQEVKQNIANHSQNQITETNIYLTALRAGSVYATFMIRTSISLQSSVENFINDYVCQSGGLDSSLHTSLNCQAFTNGQNIQLVTQVKNASNGLSSGAIAALVVCLVGIPLLIAAILLYIRFRKPSLWKVCIQRVLFWYPQKESKASSLSKTKQKVHNGLQHCHRKPSSPMLQVHLHSSLRQLTRARLLDDMLYSLQATGAKWKVMVVDKRGLRILSAACRMNDLISRGITLIESLEAIRDPLPMLDVIYFMSPNDESFLSLIADQNTQLDWTPSLYNAIHIFACNRISESLLQCIHSIGGRRLLSKLVTLKEIQVDYLAVGENVYHLDRTDSLYQLTKEESRKEEIFSSGCQFCTLLSVWNRFQRSWNMSPLQLEWKYDDRNVLLEQWVSCVQQQWEGYYAHFDNPLNISSEDRKRDSCCSVLIWDRTSDLITPLLHDLSVENICLEMKENGEWKDGMPLPDDADEYWSLLRYERISIASQMIAHKLQSFLSEYRVQVGSMDDENTIAQSSTSNSLHEMAKMVRDIPQYQEEKAKLTKYIDLLHRCLLQVENRKLIELSQLEQDIVSGRTVNGKSIQSGSSKWEHLMERVETFLSDSSTREQDKMRIILLWSLCWGLSITQRNRWLQMAQLHENVQVIRALKACETLNVSDSQKERKKRREETKRFLSKKHAFSQSTDHEEELYERVIPAVCSELENILGKIEDNGFVSEDEERRTGRTKNATDKRISSSSRVTKSVRRSRSRRRSAPSDDYPSSSAQIEKRRILIFVLGGVTLYEIRNLQSLAERYPINLVVGGSCILTGASYLSQLSRFGRAFAFELIKSLKLLPDGSKLLVTGRDESKVSQLVQSLLENRPNLYVTGKVLDLNCSSVQSDIASLFQQEEANSYSSSYLVNNAGTLGPLGPLEECDLEYHILLFP
ncbi:SNARE-interacting protein-like protein [Galdieria sulphuraria]|uniref:SNARE-interacting protein-like protein n=1 Tax=Galdieria sulphuraria TaxID=130081 RepID=M2Y6M5_GALSU|nr:SNARE-interacting protein-like protein [Galdieria sulphuraria]EME31688.1 SNARE-interacting protein-like protein [Galdieria sulphuraria]|eukprot:XP_005708208.1 SNARE-interacting protein-like protein [Galdieria sulphuraria]